ncbi:DUF4856 domain-containing protein [Paracrocinitomix mangrovi]|uniref:DUF4856 domain-containing protein n=1 Tax=Paracrocinitomix mangrovi TaxID=2862509 RepID=UPI001C8E8F75|nr:DUF4856 domain-containing protein [Paracrocinitomix mangrovi]UKN02073.1 DUF4856 domain-containing protein [Paracrocinitomix mangrovi]
MKRVLVLIAIGGLTITSCKKKGCTDEDALNYSTEAEKDDGSCYFLDIPTTYSFSDNSGNATVSYDGQTERLDQLEEMAIYMESGASVAISTSNLNDMFYNVNGDGNGNFSFTSSKMLADKCFTTDSATITGWFDSLAIASQSFANTASNGQAGVLTSGTSTYLFDARGFEYAEMIEKGIMGAVFMNQALNVYFGDDKMNVDNTTAVDPDNGKYYTTMEHHWDEAFGYFGVAADFPTNTTDIRFWGKYCNSRNADLSSNTIMMNAFLEGRAAIVGDELTIRDENILVIREMWERICAAQAVAYLQEAQGYFGNDNAKYLHALSEAYAFVKCLTYVPLATRKISYTQIDTILTQYFGDNLWDMSTIDNAAAINELKTTYGF